LDASDAAHPRRTGIGIYSEKLIGALARVIPQDRAAGIRLCFRPAPYLRSLRQAWPRNFSTRLLLDPWLPLPRATLFHGLNQRLPKQRYPLRVVTLHERYPPVSSDYSTPEFQRHMAARLSHAIHDADYIIAVSNTVREHLLRYDSALQSKIRVIYHGVEPPSPATEVELAELFQNVLGWPREEPFFLNVGAIQERKNIAGVALALKQLPKLRLVLAGADGHGADRIHATIRKEGLSERVRILGHTAPAQLRLLYCSATALVFPSFEEAFGLPVLEAMSYGLPVITSNCSAMPEVAGDAALLVDPHNVAELAEAMRRVSEDRQLAHDLAQKGRRRAAQFRWEECASRTWELYCDALREFPGLAIS
jgi:glycosyltransferase involved in cell wall biosynthesis